jgi:circadian clock protein KaiC
MSSSSVELARLPTGIPGLDAVLCGGLFQGGVYIVRGEPGAGKTIFANQACFHHVGTGGRALYVTLLAESHSRMLQHMATLRFFDPAPIPAALYYISAFRILEEDGLKGVLDLLRQEIARHRASLVVVDGLLAVAESSASDREFRKFIHELQGYAVLEGCVALLTTNGNRSAYHPEYTMVDGMITLARAHVGARTERQLEVDKLRGSESLPGRHAFEITGAGITVYPRTETLFARPSPDDKGRGQRVTTGLPELDRMLGGGIPAATATLLLGPPGAGKTVVGLHYACCAAAAEPALFFTFYETPDRLRMKAQSLGFDLDRLIAEERLEVAWAPPAENLLDAIAQRMLSAVDRKGVRRLFIDGLGGFEETATHGARLPQFFGALINELRTRNVTTIFTGETRVMIGSEVVSPIAGLSIIAENIILLRLVELRSRLYRLLSVLKIRDSDFDVSLREFHIGRHGIAIDATGDSAEAILGERDGDRPRRRVRAETGPDRPKR